MAKITFLGTAASIATKTRDNTSFLVSSSKETFLIDCPGSIVQKLLKIGFDFKKLKNVVITHHHPDHVYGIISLVHSQFIFNDEINIYSNAHTIKLIKSLLKLFRLNRSKFPKINYINVFKKGPFYSSKSLKLKAIKNNHCKDSFGILFKTNKKNILYSSDTCFYPEMLTKLKNINYLIHDCTASSSYFKRYPALYKMHTNSKQLAQFLSKRSKTKLIPIHFLLLKRGEEKRMRKELSAVRGVRFVKDFDAIRI